MTAEEYLHFFFCAFRLSKKDTTMILRFLFNFVMLFLFTGKVTGELGVSLMLCKTKGGGSVKNKIMYNFASNCKFRHPG